MEGAPSYTTHRSRTSGSIIKFVLHQKGEQGDFAVLNEDLAAEAGAARGPVVEPDRESVEK